MTPEQKQRIEQIREHLAQRKAETPPLPSTEIYIAHVDFLLSLVKSQEAASYEPQCVKCGHEVLNYFDGERLECSLMVIDGSPPQARICGCKCRAGSIRDAAQRFYFIDSHGDEAFVREADYNHATTSMRSACVEKVKALWKRYHDDAEKADSANDNINMLILLHKASAASEVIKELESVSIQEQETKQS